MKDSISELLALTLFWSFIFYRQLLWPKLIKAFFPKHAKLFPISIVCFEFFGFCSFWRLNSDTVLNVPLSTSFYPGFTSFFKLVVVDSKFS